MKRGKKLLSLLLALLLCLSLFPPALAEEAEGTIAPVEDLTEERPALPEETEGTIAPAESGAIAPVGDELQDAATSGACGENLTWTLEDKVLTISGSGPMYDFTAETVPWAAFWPTWNNREDPNQIEKVILEPGITRIGSYAFFPVPGSGFSAMLVIPETVAEIAAFAIGSYHSRSFTLTFLGDALLFDENAFSGAYVQLRYPEGNDTWTESVLQTYGASKATWSAYQKTDLLAGTCGENLTWVLDAYGVLTISGTGEMSAFVPDVQSKFGFQIHELVVEEGVTTIADRDLPVGLYSNCIFRVSLPSTLKRIGSNAFWQNPFYTIQFPDGLLEIGSSAFEISCLFGSLRIPGSVERIGEAAFRETGLTELVLEDGVREIGAQAFMGCKLCSVVIPASVTSIGENAFSSNPDLAEITFMGTMAQWKQAAPHARDPYQTTIHCCDGDILPVDSSVCGDNLIWMLSGDGVLTIAGTGDMWDFTCVQKDGQTLSTAPWMDRKNEIKTLKVLSGVTGIGKYAFGTSAGSNSASQLTSVSFPDTLKRIGENAFANCTSLQELALPSRLETWGDQAFRGCTGLKTLNVAEGITEIGVSAFSQCSALTHVTLPDNLTCIKVTAFSGCSSLTSISIPETVRRIEAAAFSGCSSLTSVTLPASLNELESSAFQGCSRLSAILVAAENTCFSSRYGILYDKSGETLLLCPGGKAGSLRIPAGVKHISDRAFQSCTELTEIDFPEGLLSIGEVVFCSLRYGTNKLTTVNLPSTLTRIGNQAFYHCTALSSITIPASVRVIGGNAFGGCTGLKEIRFEGSAPEILDRSEANNYIQSGNEGYDLFYDVTATAYYLQADPSWTEEVRRSFGGTITWVGYGPVATGQCGDALTWSLDADGTLTISGTGDMWDFITIYGTNYGPWASVISQIKQIVVEPGVTSIGKNAFLSIHMDHLEKVTLPEGLLRVGDGAFNAISSPLSELVFPESVISIGDGAINFWQIKRVTIPAGVTEIGTHMIGGNCRNLTDVYYGGTMAAWKQFGLRYDHYLTTIHCSDGDIAPAESIYCGDDLIWTLSDSGLLTVAGSGDMWDFSYDGSPWYDRRSEIRSVRLMSGVTGVGECAFYRCEGMIQMSLPESLTRIGDSAFQNCSSLAEASFPKSITSIGTYAFEACDSLTEISISETLSTIGEAAFSGCNSLKSIQVAAGNPAYASRDGILYDREGTTLLCFPGGKCSTVVIPDDVTAIGEYAFRSCRYLTEVTIPASVASLGMEAFYDCDALSRIRFCGEAPSFGINCLPSCDHRVYYPSTEPTWNDIVTNMWSNKLTWVPYLPGDANDDAAVDILDMVRLRKQLAGISVELNEISADLNGDWEITPLDLMQMRKLLVGDPA